jgi:HD-GYP domain-containing protein (c-di-GMP phosphodiesterase class II)
MYGTSATLAAPVQSRVEHSPGADDLLPLAWRLNREFRAPVGLFDPVGGTWQVRLGPAIEAFPAGGPTLLSALVSRGLRSLRSVLWQVNVAHTPTEGNGNGTRNGIGSSTEDVVWLGLLVPGNEGRQLIALAGFAASADVPNASHWGPVCPEPALLAWGQSVADKIQGECSPQDQGHGGASAGDPAGRGEGHERLLIARLIRRLRISDAPERFQVLATGALRGALGVAAVAWIPGHLHEPATVSGEVEGLRSHGYRALVPRSGQGPVHIVNHVTGAPGTRLARYLAVAADSQGSAGWLIAANPLDDRPFSTREVEVLQPVASLVATQQTNARLYADLKELLFGVIRALTAAIDAKDPYTSGHSERVARIAVRLAQELGIAANQQSDLYLMGLLHDVGKIGVDDAVLKKSGPLTPEEYKVIQAHVEIGVHILADLKKLSHLLPGVRHHHECLDGSGYPCGLAGDEIPLEARILAVADSFDAMSSTRPYRRRLTPMQIDKIFREGAGVQWDPRIVDALFACRLDVEHIRQKGLGESLQIVVNETLGRTGVPT